MIVVVILTITAIATAINLSINLYDKVSESKFEDFSCKDFNYESYGAE